MFYPTTCVGLGYWVLHGLSLADFLGSMVTSAVGLPRGLSVLSRFSTPGGFACRAYTYAVQRAIPSARGSVTSPSPHHSIQE